MLTAIISDIHGNLAALETVLADLRAAGIERVVCLGDVAATGPQPHQVIERLRLLKCPVVLGNTDEWLLNPQPDPHADAETQWFEAVDLWCAQQLAPSDLDFLRTFRPTIEVGLGDGSSLIAYHGSPRSNTEQIFPTLPDADLKTALAGSSATVLAGGHVHMQMIRRFEDMLVINPGSVGLPYEEIGGVARNPPWAEYAVINAEVNHLHVELRRAIYDVRPTLEAAKTSGMPHAERWIKDWDVSNQGIHP
ncbi:MAG: metallophosphoesterase family protein [Chloroflexota bacterium]